MDALQNTFYGTLLCNQVYYIDMDEKDRPSTLHSRGQVAICPSFNFRLDSATWVVNDRSTERLQWETVTLDPKEYAARLHIASSSYGKFIVNDAPETIRLTVSGHQVNLQKLTLKVFNEKVRPFVAGKDLLHFTTDQDVQQWYLTHDFER